ncbi:MAG: ABC transporter permease [Haloarculaceae archaeon]
MALGSLLKKELHWSRHNALALLFVLLLLPTVFAATSVAFQHVIPRDAPVAVTPQDDTVTEDDVTFVKGAITLFSDPEIVEETADARRALRREEVYAVIQVPPNITDPDEENATFVFTVDGSIVPFTEASKAIRNVMGFYLQRFLPADVTVERVVVGTSNTLSEYLVPIFLLAITMLFAFTYVPYNLATEANVLDRLRVEASLESVLWAKLVYFAILMLVPVGVFAALASWMGYAVTAVAPGAVIAIVLTFVILSAVSMAIMVVTQFSTLGRFLNVVILLGLLGFGGLAYPLGYFSPLRKLLVQFVPVYYSMVVTRSSMLKGVPLSVYADILLGLAGVAVLALLVLKLSAVYYRRTV